MGAPVTAHAREGEGLGEGATAAPQEYIFYKRVVKDAVKDAI